MRNIDYLATISEDTLFRSNESAKAISDIISGKTQVLPMSKRASLDTASTLIKYLIEYKEKYWFNPTIAINSKISNIDEILDECSQFIEKAKGGDSYFIEIDDLLRQYPIGSTHEGVIVSIQDYGLIIQIGLNASGLIHISNIEDTFELGNFEVGEYIDVEIIDINQDKKKFSLVIKS